MYLCPCVVRQFEDMMDHVACCTKEFCDSSVPLISVFQEMLGQSALVNVWESGAGYDCGFQNRIPVTVHYSSYLSSCVFLSGYYIKWIQFKLNRLYSLYLHIYLIKEKNVFNLVSHLIYNWWYDLPKWLPDVGYLSTHWFLWVLAWSPIGLVSV